MLFPNPSFLKRSMIKKKGSNWKRRAKLPVRPEITWPPHRETRKHTAEQLCRKDITVIIQCLQQSTRFRPGRKLVIPARESCHHCVLIISSLIGKWTHLALSPTVWGEARMTMTYIITFGTRDRFIAIDIVITFDLIEIIRLFQRLLI